MDQQLRQLERQALDDPEALRRYHVALCRVEGHQYTSFKRFEDPLSKDHLEVRVCWRCHNTEIQGEQKYDPTSLPDVVTYQNNLHGAPYHALINIKIKKIKTKKARKKGQPDTTVVGEKFSDIKVKTACGMDLRIAYRGRMVYQKEVTCQRCIKNKKRMKQARESVNDIYPKLHAMLRETFKERAEAEYGTPYIPPLKLGDK
jgi:hypothetical protein